MSWNRRIFKKYNREETREETWSLWDAFLDDEYREWDWFDEFPAWFTWDYPGNGCCYSMDEYHKMHLLTLLRKLNLKTAKHITEDRGW